MTRHYITTLALALGTLALAACGTGKGTARQASPYQRKPITEVTQERLDIDSRLIGAVALKAAGKQAEALEAYAALSADHPTEAAAWYGQAQLLAQRGWVDSTLACAERAAALADSNLWYKRFLVDAYARAGRNAEAVAVQRRLVELEPENLENYYTLSNLNIDLGDLPAAVEALNLVERRIGVTEPISLQKQRLWEAAGKPDRALREVEALAAALPADKHYNAVLAQQYIKQGKPAKAKQCYDRILAADPDDEYIHVQLAEYYAQAGDDARTDAEVAAAVRNPRLDSGTKLQVLAMLYPPEVLRGPRGAQVLRLADSLVQADPWAEGHLICGQMLIQVDRYAPALAHFEASLAADSTHFESWEGAMICLLMTGERADDLASYARRAARLFPTHTLPYYVQAQQAVVDHRYEDCLAALKPALMWGFSHGYLEQECYNLLAEAYYRLGRYDEAWRAFDHLLELDADDAPTLNNYAYYLGEQGLRMDDALRMSARSLELEPDNANSLDTYGWLLHLMGRDADALPPLRRAVRLSPASDTLQCHLAEVEKALRP